MTGSLALPMMLLVLMLCGMVYRNGVPHQLMEQYRAFQQDFGVVVIDSDTSSFPTTTPTTTTLDTDKSTRYKRESEGMTKQEPELAKPDSTRVRATVQREHPHQETHRVNKTLEFVVDRETTPTVIEEEHPHQKTHRNNDNDDKTEAESTDDSTMHKLQEPEEKTTETVQSESTRNNDNNAEQQEQQQEQQESENHHPKKNNKRRRSNHAVFYNVYIHPSEPSTGFKIVSEQLDLVVQGGYLINSTVYYNLIGGGGDNNKNDTMIPCPPPLQCRLLKRYNQAFEEVTLSALHRYCRRHPTHTVTYLHNKGSFNTFTHNHRNRRLVTRVLASGVCHAMKLKTTNNDNEEEDYNVCGPIFQFNPHFHFSTNMWTAQCNYIQHLSPPDQYEALRFQMCRHLVESQPHYHHSKCFGLVNTNNHNGSNHQQQQQLAERWVAAGLGRHAMEWWIASHPSLRPCMAMQQPLYEFETGFESSLVPQLVQPYHLPHVVPNTTMASLEFALQQYYYLHGTIHGGICELRLDRIQDSPCLDEEEKPSYLRNITSIAQPISKQNEA